MCFNLVFSILFTIFHNFCFVLFVQRPWRRPVSSILGATIGGKKKVKNADKCFRQNIVVVVIAVVVVV